MPLFTQKKFEPLNISGHQLDSSKLNKLGNIRLSPLKSLAILFFILTLLLPKAISQISDFNFYFSNFSIAKELAKAAEISKTEKENYFVEAERKEIEEPKPSEESKQKKLALADIWPEASGGERSAPPIVSIAQAALSEAGAIQPKKQAFRLVIPAIKVSANIESLGVKPSGEMESPNDFRQAGWFNLGSRPGESGIALIAGHLNNQYGAPGVFWHLSKLKAGDDIYIANESGKIIHFKVLGSRIYPVSTPLGEIYEKGGSVRLNLITCDGAWDKKAQNYTSRLVVSAELAAE